MEIIRNCEGSPTMRCYAVGERGVVTYSVGVNTHRRQALMHSLKGSVGGTLGAYHSAVFSSKGS